MHRKLVHWDPGTFMQFWCRWVRYQNVQPKKKMVQKKPSGNLLQFAIEIMAIEIVDK